MVNFPYLEWLLNGHETARKTERERDWEETFSIQTTRACEFKQYSMMDDIKYAVLMRIGAAQKCNDPFFFFSFHRFGINACGETKRKNSKHYLMFDEEKKI